MPLARLRKARAIRRNGIPFLKGASMNGSQAIQSAIQSTQFVVTALLEDLSDADLLIRPVPGANHIAWQLGHLIDSEVQMIKDQLPGTAYPEFPAGFAK